MIYFSKWKYFFYIYNCLFFKTGKIIKIKKMNTKFTKIFTLMFVVEDNRVLLGFKKRGFGSGKYNGFGGKVELNESIY